MSDAGGPSYEECAQLSGYKKCVERIQGQWNDFRVKREERLREGTRNGGNSPEKVAEDILSDLFTEVLDWSLGDLNHQVKFADMLLSKNFYKWLIVEAKRPGSLVGNRVAIDSALEQAWGYADKQKVKRVAVSDGEMLYAAERGTSGLRDRIYVSLRDEKPPLDLWWLSVFGIGKDRRYDGESMLATSFGIAESKDNEAGDEVVQERLHPKHQVPVRCFAYVGSYGNMSTWKLPYLLADGSVDGKKLPKALQCLFSNYRGKKVQTIPDEAQREVIRKLEKAARQAGHLPPSSPDPNNAYRLLQDALDQMEAER